MLGVKFEVVLIELVFKGLMELLVLMFEGIVLDVIEENL